MNRRTFLAFSAIGFTSIGIAAGYNWWMTRRVLIRLKLISSPANLLRNSDLSICTNPNIPDYWGTSAPATIEDWQDSLHIENGSPVQSAKALHLHNPSSGRPISFLSYGSFVPESVPYTFSVYLRSDVHDCPVALAIGWSQQTNVMIGLNWQRYSMTYSPVGESTYRRAIPVRISLQNQGSLWIAAPQLQKGERASDFSLALMDDHPLPIADVWKEDYDDHPRGPIKTLGDSCATAVVAGTRHDRNSEPPAGLGDAHAGSTRPNETLRAIAIIEPEDWCLEDIASHGFNAVSIFVPTSEAGRQTTEIKRIRNQFDAAARMGLRVLPILDHQKDTAFGRLRDAVTGIISALKDHPAIAAWMLLDEPGRWWENTGAGEQQVTELYRAAKQTDPHRPIFVNDNFWAPGKGGYGSLEASDIGCNDLYPIGQYSNAVQFVADRCAMIGRDCIAVGKPAAFWLQMYGYDDAVREPTPDEQRAMTYLAYIAGVRLLFYWLYKPMNTALWDAMKPLGDEIDRLDQTLSQSDARCTRIGTVGLRMHYAFWEGKDVCYLAACNASDERTTARFDLEKLTSRRFMRSRGWYGLDESGVAGELSLSLDGYQREVVELW